MADTIPCALTLLALKNDPPAEELNTYAHRILKLLKEAKIQPLVLGTVADWIVSPYTAELGPPLTSQRWHICAYLPGEGILPETVTSLVADTYQLAAQAPTPMVESVRSNNKAWLNLPKDSIAPLTGSLDKPRVIDPELEVNLTPELETILSDFSKREPEGKRPISMLNFLRYNPGKKGSMREYQTVFNENVGAKRGAQGKIFGFVSDGTKDEWEEIVFVDYPTIWHFADLLASEEYRECDKKYKVGVIKDTGILCISEIEV